MWTAEFKIYHFLQPFNNPVNNEIESLKLYMSILTLSARSCLQNTIQLRSTPSRQRQQTAQLKPGTSRGGTGSIDMWRIELTELS